MAFLIYTTFPDNNEAERIISGLLDASLIACGNIMAQHTALYRWEGKVASEGEVGSLLKTTKENYKLVQDYILENHSYDTPCVMGWSADEVAPDFAQWISKEVKS